jgi:hypothetical protein
MMQRVYGLKSMLWNWFLFMKPTPSFFQPTNKVVLKVATFFGLCKGHKRVNCNLGGSKKDLFYIERSSFAN